VARASYDVFDEAWRSAFRYADVMTPTPGRISAEDFAALEQHWSPAQIVEITSVICMFNFFNRFANALDIPPTR
jgi:alkylhydroperoxidase family enzyme